MIPILDFQNISRSFQKGIPVLKGVTFSMHEGEVLGLLGRNGAGKTTLIRIAMGMLFPHSARCVSSDSLPPTSPSPSRSVLDTSRKTRSYPCGRALPI